MGRRERGSSFFLSPTQLRGRKGSAQKGKEREGVAPPFHELIVGDVKERKKRKREEKVRKFAF